VNSPIKSTQALFFFPFTLYTTCILKNKSSSFPLILPACLNNYYTLATEQEYLKERHLSWGKKAFAFLWLQKCLQRKVVYLRDGHLSEKPVFCSKGHLGKTDIYVTVTQI
jgi:hypothetical protein